MRRAGTALATSTLVAGVLLAGLAPTAPAGAVSGGPTSVRPPTAAAGVAAPVTASSSAEPATPTDRAKPKPRHPIVKNGVYRTVGYAGRRTLPRTGPAPAPPSITLGTHGWKPDVHVDAAGTAHIVWVDQVDAAGNDYSNDVLNYCRIPRGAKKCDNPDQTPFDPAATPSEDFAGPRILQIGDGLVVLTYRYPTVRPHPDGETSDRALYAYTSTDGGTSWSPPSIVGTQGPQGGAVVFGGSDPRIAVISDTQTGGTVVQTITPGLYTRASVTLGPGDEAYSGRLAVDGTQPVAAFAALSGYGVVRRLADGGDPTDVNAWSRTEVPGLSSVDLASGPKGVYLFGQASSGNAYTVRPVVDGVPGAAKALPEPDNGAGPVRDFVEDPGGTLHGFYRDRVGSTLFGTDSADGGRTWSPLRTVAAATTASSVSDVQASAAADGGGVVVYRRDSTGLTSGTVAATPFGTLAPTGKPGAGGLAGEGIPGAYAGCDQVTFGLVRVTPTQGCLLPSVDPKFPGAAVSAGPIDINGLRIEPDAGARILIDPRTKAIDTTGKVSVVLRGAGLAVTLLHAELHLRLSNTGDGAVLFDIDPGNLDLAGFPIAGRVMVQLTPTGARVPLSLSLPGAFGGVTGAATLVLDSGRGVRLDSVHLGLARAPLGPMEIRDLSIDYIGSSETWRGAATLGLPPQPTGAALKADVTFVKGRFQMGNFAISQWPGIAIGPNVYFHELRGGFGLDPVAVRVGASFGAFPIAPPDAYTVRVDGDMTLTVSGGQVLLNYTGVGSMANIALEKVVLNATTDGYADLTAGYDVDLKLVRLSGHLDGFISGPRKQFGATADATVRIAGVPAVGQRAAISTEGIGACYTVLGTSWTAGYRFGQPVPGGVQVGASLGDCSLTQFEVPRPPRSRAAPGESTFSVVKGTKVQNVELTAAPGSAPPTVTLRAPDGSTVTPVDVRTAGSASGAAVALTLPEGARTVVALRSPKAGTWTVVPTAESAPIAQVRVARDAPPVVVTARVVGTGATRTLRYQVRNGAGATVRFAELGGPGASADIGAAKGASGTLRFVPAAGKGGTRQIVATVSRGGIPVSATVVTRYKAPSTGRPGAVKGVRAARTKNSVRVSWRAVSGASRYVVTVHGGLSDRTLTVTTTGRARSVVVRGINVDDGRLTVTVTAQNRLGLSGRPGRARA